MYDKKKYIAMATGVLLLSSSRIFVAGAVSATEILFFYDAIFPSIFGIILAIVAAAIVDKFDKRLAAVFIAAYTILFSVIDNARYLHLIAAFVLIISLSLLSELKEYYPYVAAGFALDISLRVLAAGGEPFDFLHTKIILAAVLIIASAFLFTSEGKMKKPSFALYAFATILELGLAYPNAILRYSGFRVYYLREYLIMSICLVAVIAGALLLSNYIKEKKIFIAMLLITSLTVFVGGFVEIIGLLMLLIFLVGLQTYQPFEGSRLGSILGAVFFIVISTLAVMCYYGRDLGMGVLEDNLEYIIFISVLVYIATSVFSKEKLSFTINLKKDFIAFIVPILITSLFAVSLYNLSPTYEEPKEEIKIWSYNVHFGFTPDGAFNGYELIKLLKNEKPDIIAMQEVMGGSIESAYQDVPVMISAFTGMAYEFKPAIEETYGVAIFAKYPVEYLNDANLWSKGQTRPLLIAQVSMGEARLTIACVHLGLSPDERYIQAKELLNYTLADPKAVILAGDFNAEISESTIQVILQHYMDSFPKRPQVTWKWGSETHSIDYVFLLKGSSLNVVSTRVIETNVSDHYPVEVIIKLD